jgi:drug/metabolite transporter (DMT)-like permease
LAPSRLAPRPLASSPLAPSPLATALTLAALILIWGSTFSVIQVGLEYIPPMTGIALRFAIASVLLLTLAWKKGIPLGRSRRERRLWWVNGLLTFCFSYWVTYWAEQYLPSALAAILYATFPLFVGLLAHWMIPDEPLTREGLAGAALGILGVAWIFADDLSGLGGPMLVPAALVMLLSPLSASVANVAVKKWGSGLHPLSVTAVPMGICAVIMGSLALVFESDREIIWNLRSVGSLLYLGIMGSAVTFTLYFWLLGFLRATRLSLITFGVPIMALLIGVVIRNEPVTLGMLGGTALVLTGVALAFRVPAGRRKPPPARPGSASTP